MSRIFKTKSSDKNHFVNKETNYKQSSIIIQLHIKSLNTKRCGVDIL